MNEVIPCLSDLVRDWQEDRPELHPIIIHKALHHDGVVHGRLILKDWIVGFIEDDYVDLRFANSDGVERCGMIHAVDPEFFDRLHKDLLVIINGPQPW